MLRRASANLWISVWIGGQNDRNGALRRFVPQSVIWSAVAESAGGFAEADAATSLAEHCIDSKSGSAEDSAAALHTMPGTVKVDPV